MGHTYYKSSDCPTCPVCENERKPDFGFLSDLAAPARRALEKEELTTLKKISAKTINEILSLHGMGPSSIRKLEKALKKAGLTFRG